jgi:hypothetical protein
MRLARLLLIALGPAALAGCLHEADRPRWLDNLSLLRPTPEADAAAVKYVLVERPAGGEEINRRVWDRIDEQFLPFETRVLLEDAGLRVGIATDSAPGPLRKMIEDPRTARGHRGRTFALDRPAPLAVSLPVQRAEFSVQAAEGGRTTFVRDDVALGFDVTVRDAGDGKVLVHFVPHARYRDPNQLLPTGDGVRDQATETFPGVAFEVTLAASEYLVIGTDWYWEGTFGHQAFSAEKGGRAVQRLLVLHAGRTKADRTGPTLLTGEDGQAVAPPLASQATAARGARP